MTFLSEFWLELTVTAIILVMGLMAAMSIQRSSRQGAKRPSKFEARLSSNKGAGHDVEKQGIDPGSVILTEIKDRLVLDFPSQGDKVLFSFEEKTGYASLHLFLLATNPSAYELTVEKLSWEIWIGNYAKSGLVEEPQVIPAKTNSFSLKVHEGLSETEAKTIFQTSQTSSQTCYVEGTVYASTRFGKFQRKFSLCNIEYAMEGFIESGTEHFDIRTHLDSLTGLLQRRYLEDHLKGVLKSRVGNYPISFMMIDMDNFKGINDKYGHLVGDDALRIVCSKIKEVIGDKGVAFRYGGDEFCVVLECQDSDEVEYFAQRIKALIEKYNFSVPGGQIHLTVSLGVATLRRPSHYNELIKRADDMLLKSKREGKNQVYVYRGS